jgi:Cof subfamily protein (haloacid dehalogenase superfamily)
MKISAVCTDIDGTLLDSRRELSQRTIEVFRKISDTIPVILASSRMPSAMRHLQHQLGITRYPMICYNGGFLVQYKNEDSTDVLASVGIAPTTGLDIFKLAQGTDIHVSIYRGHEWIAPRMDSWTDREETITKVKSTISDVGATLERWAVTGDELHKVMCMGREDEIEGMEQQLRTQLGSKIHIYRSRPTYLELAPKEVSKATGLEVILQQYGIPLGEVLAFGDNYNDIEMLREAGIGVAVANSREEVKSVANEITLRSVDDGVAIFIEKYLLS